MRRGPFLASTTAFALSGAGTPARADVAPTQLVVAPLAGLDVVALYYAAQQGWFKQAGLDVIIQPVANGAAGMSALVAGAVQIAFANVLSLCVAHSKNIPVKLLAPGAGYNSSTPTARLLVAGDSTIHSVRELEHKIIALPVLGDINAIGVAGLLDQAGVDAAKVQFAETPAAAMLPALLSKRVDAIAIYEPIVSAAIAQGARPIAKQYDSIALKFMVASWVAYGPWLAAHHDAAVAFATTLNRASQFANVHHDELIPLIAGFTKQTPEVLSKLPYPTVSATLDTALIQPVIDAASKYHMIPAPFRARDLIYDGVS